MGSFYVAVNVWIQSQQILVGLGNQLLFTTAATIFCYSAVKSSPFHNISCYFMVRFFIFMCVLICSV